MNYRRMPAGGIWRRSGGKASCTYNAWVQNISHLPTWTVAEAKAKFSQVIEQARTGPQTITRNGRLAAVVVAVEEWERRASRTGNLAQFLVASPLRGSRLKIERSRDRPRDIEL